MLPCEWLQNNVLLLGKSLLMRAITIPFFFLFLSVAIDVEVLSELWLFACKDPPFSFQKEVRCVKVAETHLKISFFLRNHFPPSVDLLFFKGLGYVAPEDGSIYNQKKGVFYGFKHNYKTSVTEHQDDFLTCSAKKNKISTGGMSSTLNSLLN